MTEMTKSEHGMLKNICDAIWYEKHYWRELYLWNDGNLYCRSRWPTVNIIDIWIQEVIFNSIFLDKLEAYVMTVQDNTWYWWIEMVWEDMRKHLDKPVEYLHNWLDLKIDNNL